MVSGSQFAGPSSSFPGRETWLDFITLFNINKPQMLSTGNSGEDVGRIFNAINEAAKLGVEERVILCIIMQESGGNVGVDGTVNADGHGTTGLMQCDGSPSFQGQHNLSQDDITAMVMAGTRHLKSNLQQVGDQDTAVCIYEACRLYNTGSIPDNANLSDVKVQGRDVGTASYVSDIANRLQGRF